MWDVKKCDFCGDCLVRCQYVNYEQNQAAEEIRALTEGRDANILHQCVTCCGCSEYCPKGADPFDLILKAMEDRNTYPVSEDTVKMFSLFGATPNVITSGDPDKPALSICLMENNLPPDAIKSRMFDGLTIVKGGDFFCQVGWLHIGKAKPIEKKARKFIDALDNLNKEIIFLHDDCYAMVHAMVRDFGIQVPFRYMHLFEYLRNWLIDHRNEIKPLGFKVAYQRPCASRFTPEKDIFLDEIFELVGVDRPPRKYDRDNSLCCTAAFRRVYPEKAKEFEKLNLDDAKSSGADALVSLCPMCDRVLKKPADARGLRGIYITDLCRMALGEILKEK
jgi:Fe-S oxidoreductase